MDRINKIPRKEMFTNEKAKQTFFQHLIVPIWHIIWVLLLKTHAHADFC